MLSKRLLVIEDDIDTLDQVSDLLREAGYDVLTAATGRDGLKILHAGTALDLVLLDFWLPDMTGHAFLATRTRWPDGVRLPVLLVTGDDAWVDENRDLRQLGVVGLLRKPFEPQQIEAAVERALSGEPPKIRMSAPPAVPVQASTPVTQLGPRQTRRLSDMLVRASELLAQSVDISAQLREVTRLVVPRLADFCVIEQADPAAHQHRLLHSTHNDPALAEPLRALAERPEGLLRSVAEVLETGQPQLHERVTDETLEGLARSPDDLGALRALGIESVIVVPMMARGRVFGAMTWVSSSAHRGYGRAHLETAADLAHRVALALDNEQLLRREQDAVRSREELVALVSHDLRTPLSTIAGTANRLLQRGGAPTDSDAVATILRNAQVMERLVRDLLDYSQLDVGSLRVELRKEKLPELLAQALEGNHGSAGLPAPVLEVDEGAHDLVAMCDRQRVLQVLSTLLGSLPRVASARPGCLRLSVVDGEARVALTGLGTATSDELPALVEGVRPFATTRAEAGGAAGVGLFVARGLVEAHGGRVWLQSDAGGGSTVVFTLPLGMQSESHISVAPQRPILLVDDDVAFRRELQEILRERGYPVETADNGWQAWSYLQSSPPPALILLDLMMPVMDGWELHAAIKSHPLLASVPTVIVSCLDRYRIELSLADAQDYIEKPIRTAQLFDVVQRHIAGPALARSPSLRPALHG